MKKSTITLLAVLGGIGLAIVLLIGSYASAVAFGAQQERAIEATWNNNRNILGNYTTRVAEMAQVPGMQKDDLREVMQAAFEGRYGENGSQAVMQWIKEAYPGTLDNQLYRNIQSTIESGRIDFQNNQTKLLDQKRVYQTNLDYVFKGTMLKIAGYPKVDLDKFNIVTSTSAERSFQTGVDDGVQLRRN